MRRELLELLLGVTRLAVEPLLQVVEGRDLAVAHDQQLAVEHRVEVAAPSTRSGKLPAMSSPVREIEPRLAVGRATTCTRMPSHFHSAAKSAGSSAAKSPSSSACDSISGRNGRRVARRRASAARPRARRTAARRAARAPCQTSSISSTSRPAISATAVLASRAETPTRSAPVSSLSSAQRPVASSASSQVSSRGPRSLRPISASSATMSARRGDALATPAVRRTSGEGRRHPSCASGRPSPRPSPREDGAREAAGSPHQRDRLRRVADVVARQAEQLRVDARAPSCRMSVRRSGNENGRPSVSAASAQPRSGSGVARK